jgi:hypothetical protein
MGRSFHATLWHTAAVIGRALSVAFAQGFFRNFLTGRTEEKKPS